MIKQLTVTQLVENTAGEPGLLAEHGVSFHIEADGNHLLFDTGQGLALRHNAQQLSIPMASVEQLILSHGHYDHSGGLMEALKLTGPVDLYFHPEVFNAKYNRNGRDIGAPIADLKQIGSRVNKTILTQEPTEILSGIHVTGEIPRKNPIEDTGGPFYRDAGRTEPDELPDDQALYLEVKEGLIVLLGCGHSGVVNTLEYVQKLSGGKPVYAVIGGMHLLRASPERLAFTGDKLKQVQIQYLAPNHCTSLEAVCYFKNRFPEVFHESKAGSRHRFGNS